MSLFVFNQVKLQPRGLPTTTKTTTIFFVCSWIACSANGWKASRGGARQLLLCSCAPFIPFSLISLGLYAENAMDVARREMAWEVDYLREAKNGQHFR